MPNLIDLTGRQFGHLKVLGRHPEVKSHVRWTCLCACGRPAVVLGNKLRDGSIERCGVKCHLDRVTEVPRHQGTGRHCRRRGKEHPGATHGMACGKYRKYYQLWHNMVQRCTNPAHPKYPRYGGRGITVWEPWLDVQQFVTDLLELLGPRPEGELRVCLNRIDNNAGYCPGNVRWASFATNNANRGYDPPALQEAA